MREYSVCANRYSLIFFELVIYFAILLEEKMNQKEQFRISKKCINLVKNIEKDINMSEIVNFYSVSENKFFMLFVIILSSQRDTDKTNLTG